MQACSPEWTPQRRAMSRVGKEFVISILILLPMKCQSLGFAISNETIPNLIQRLVVPCFQQSLEDISNGDNSGRFLSNDRLRELFSRCLHSLTEDCVHSQFAKSSVLRRNRAHHLCLCEGKLLDWSYCNKYHH